MCGINGIYGYHHAASRPSRDEVVRTCDAMVNRGPDGSGIWESEDGRCLLGHRRLSILDLSDRAAQPMVFGRFIVSFNGEIYNYPELRRELEFKGRSFQTQSDTEVLLHLYALEGERMVSRLRGMFAFAIWDQQEQRLFLARDPYGIKPLYTANDGWTFRFASQVKALLAGGKVSCDPEPAGVVGFHIWGSVPEPFTLYREIRALPAGHTQLIDVAGPRAPRAYTSISQIFADGAVDPAPHAAVGPRVRAAMQDSVRAHLLADVEVGIFLSAGVDSGALLGLMKDAGQEKVRAITLAFSEFEGTLEDEAPLAAEVARFYGAEHIIRRVSEAEFLADLPVILDAMDQPSIDGINSWFVSKAAREAGLKVALSGLGADELLAGYPSFRDIPRWVSRLRVAAALPGAGFAARATMRALRIGTGNPKALGLLHYGGTYPGAYLLRRALFLPFELKSVLDPELLDLGLRRLKPLERLRSSLKPMPKSSIARVAALESANYMRNQLLRDADWAGMAHSIEIRTPFVDVELARSLAGVTARLTPASGKQALAAAPTNSLPPSITNRPKTGFAVPTGRWARSATSHTINSKGAASRAWALEVLARSTGPLTATTEAGNPAATTK